MSNNSSATADLRPNRHSLSHFERLQTVRRSSRAGFKTISSALAEYQAKWHLGEDSGVRAVRPTTPTGLGTTIFSAITELKAKWHTLQLVDRAYALEPLIKAGVKGRYLARELNCNEGLIRFYLSGLAASDADIELARRNGISYSELVRRATGRGSRVESSCEQVQLTEPTMERRIPFADATTILSWLRYDPARECSARLILQEAIRTVAAAERTGRLASLAVPTGVNADQVIESCRPDPDSFDIEVAWYAVWLGRWVVRLIPEADFRCDALNMALERVRTEKNPELW